MATMIFVIKNKYAKSRELLLSGCVQCSESGKGSPDGKNSHSRALRVTAGKVFHCPRAIAGAVGMVGRLLVDFVHLALPGLRGKGWAAVGVLHGAVERAVPGYLGDVVDGHPSLGSQRAERVPQRVDMGE
jgi:hypothetical protein